MISKVFFEKIDIIKIVVFLSVRWCASVSQAQ